MAYRWGKSGNSDFIFLGSKITADGDYRHEIRRCLILGRKAMTNRDSILKSRDITLPTKVHIVKAMVFLVVTYELEKERASHSSIIIIFFHSSILAWRIPWTKEPGRL